MGTPHGSGCKAVNTNWTGSFAVRQSKRVTIGFCLIRQSSTSPIVWFHQSNQIPAAHFIRNQGAALFWVVSWTNERRGCGTPAVFSYG